MAFQRSNTVKTLESRSRCTGSAVSLAIRIQGSVENLIRALLPLKLQKIRLVLGTRKTEGESAGFVISRNHHQGLLGVPLIKIEGHLHRIVESQGIHMATCGKRELSREEKREKEITSGRGEYYAIIDQSLNFIFMTIQIIAEKMLPSGSGKKTGNIKKASVKGRKYR